jgi:hypothetical protein
VRKAAAGQRAVGREIGIVRGLAELVEPLLKQFVVGAEVGSFVGPRARRAGQQRSQGNQCPERRRENGLPAHCF